MKLLLLMASLLIFLSSCIVGPGYQQPRQKLPEHFNNISTTEAIDLASWWRCFNSEELNVLITKAIEENHDLQLAKEKIKEVRAAFHIKEADFLPEIDASQKLSQSYLSKNTVKGAGLSSYNQSYIQTGFDALWEIDFFGKKVHDKNAAYNVYGAQIETMHHVYVTLLGDVAKVFITSKALQKKITLFDEIIEHQHKIVQLIKDQFQAGITDKFALLDAQNAVEESKKQRIALALLLEQNINNLALLLGQQPENFTLNKGIPHIPRSLHGPSTGLPSDLLRRRPDIRKAELLLRAANENIGSAVTDYFPRFSLLGSVGVESNKFSQWFSRGSLSWSIGPSITWPVITFGRIAYKVDEMKSAERQALIAYSQSIIKALGDVENSLAAYFKNKELITFIQKKCKQKEEEYAIVQDLFASGLTNNVSALQTNISLLIENINLADAEQAESIALISVYKALGGGW